jgi:predicted nucleotidyltransferase
MIIEFLLNNRGLDFFGLRIDLEEALGRSVDLRFIILMLVMQIAFHGFLQLKKRD